MRISPRPCEFRGAGAPRQYVRAIRIRRLQDGLGEIKALIGGLGTDADLLTGRLCCWRRSRRAWTWNRQRRTRRMWRLTGISKLSQCEEGHQRTLRPSTRKSRASEVILRTGISATSIGLLRSPSTSRVASTPRTLVRSSLMR